MTALDQVKRYLGHWQWNLALIEQSVDDIVANGICGSVRWLPPPPRWTFFADPFVLAEEGALRLYCEQMDYRRGVGEIWSAPVLSHAETWANPVPLLRQPGHMSFPFAFRHQGVPHLLCETWEAGGASLYAQRDDGWNFARIDLPGGPVVDGALYHDGEIWWLFCGHIGSRPDDELYLYHAADPSGPWRPHSANPVVRDRSGARSGGPLVSTGQGLIRPAQDCTRTYGGALTLKRVVELTPTAYREEVVRRLDPLPPWSGGLHHLCPAGDATIIDGKRWRFHPLDPGRKILSGWRTKRRRAMLRRKV